VEGRTDILDTRYYQ